MGDPTVATLLYLAAVVTTGVTVAVLLALTFTRYPDPALTKGDDS